MINYTYGIKKRILALIVSIAMVFSLMPALSPVQAADNVYDYQPPNADANDMQSVKLLEPSDITVIEENSECFLNQINTVIDGTADIVFSLSMTAGINNYDESIFKTYNMEVIKVYTAVGNEKGNLVAEYSSGSGELKYIGSEISDEINNQGGQKTKAVFIGLDKGVLKSGSYILEFGKNFRGNQEHKILGKDVRFKFTVKAYPELEVMIAEAESFLANAKSGSAIGEYPEDAVAIFQAAINTAKDELERINQAVENQEIEAPDAAAQKDAASEILSNALDSFKQSRNISVNGITVSGVESVMYAGDTGTAVAVVDVEPDESAYKKVRWESSSNIIIDDASGKWIATFAGSGWIRAVSTADSSVFSQIDIEILNEENTASYTYGSDVSLEEALGEDIANITSLKLFTVNNYAFNQTDLNNIRTAMPALQRIDMEHVKIDAIGSGWFKNWTTLEEIVLPENLLEINGTAFYGCANLKNVVIPATVSKIGDSAFANCTSLNDTLVVLAANPPTLEKTDPSWGIGDAFNGFGSDKPASVTTFRVPYGSKVDYEKADYWNRYNFVEMDKKELSVHFETSGGLEAAAEKVLAEKGWRDDEITSLTITSPDGVVLDRTTDMVYLQNNFMAATTIDLSGTIFDGNNLRSSTFEARRNMKYVELPANITHIGKKVFYGCSNLRTLTIPEGVKYKDSANPGIGENALAECPKLETLIFLPLEPPGYNSGMPTTVKNVYVPNLCIDDYKAEIPIYRDKIKPILTVTANDVKVEAQQNATMKATVNAMVPYEGNLKWEIVTDQDAENPVATVDETTGAVQAYRYGTVTVKVTAGYNTAYECSDTCTLTVTKLPAVSMTASVASYNSAKLSWKALSGMEGYQIFRASSKTGEFTLEETVTSKVTSYTDTGLLTGRTYYYKIRGYKTVNGVKVYSEYSAVKSAKPYLTTPTVSAARYSYSTNKVSWKAVSGASGYKIYRATSKSGTYKLIATKNSKYTSIKDTGRTTGTTYYYKVRAYRTISGDPVYSSYSTVKSATPSLSKVSSVKTAKAGTRKIKVSWKKTAGASGYVVYRSTKKSSGYKAVKTIKSGSTVKYTTDKLTKNKKYYFKVRAYRNVKVNGKTKKVYGPYSSVVYRTAK